MALLFIQSEFCENYVASYEREEVLTIVNDQHGTPTYAGDLAEAITVILDKAEGGEWKNGVYHFSNLGETTWYGFAEK